jgi:carbamoyltransferase
MRDRINKAVKKRESFRPFAPSVKLEKAHIYFEINQDMEFPYMLFTAQVKEEYKKVLPAITHVDGSARIQTVNKNDHPLYWKLINEFEKKSNIPILLNTSFNVKGQPIVCSPEDAVKTLLSTDIDALFIGQYYVKKNG